jgi:hypothetical protein
MGFQTKNRHLCDAGRAVGIAATNSGGASGVQSESCEGEVLQLMLRPRSSSQQQPVSMSCGGSSSVQTTAGHLLPPPPPMALRNRLPEPVPQKVAAATSGDGGVDSRRDPLVMGAGGGSVPGAQVCTGARVGRARAQLRVVQDL